MHREVLTKEGAKLFPTLAAFGEFYLAGGTALALQIGHRISVDFDFFSDDPIPPSLVAKVKRVCKTAAVQVRMNNPDELTILVDGVKVTFLYYPFPVVLPFISYAGLQLLSVAEIGATKAAIVGRRGKFKDYVDLYFILKDSYITLDGLLGMTERKFGDEFNARLFLEQLLFMDDFEDYQIDFLQVAVTAAEILDFFQGAIVALSLDRIS